MPMRWDGQILAPFPIESTLSGVKKPLKPDQWLWYQRRFVVPTEWRGDRVLLNFDAVDWECVVYVNNTEVGRHCGGFDPFSFDITDALEDGGEQLLALRVWDPTDSKDESGGEIARGKQSISPGLIHYTASSGIWQTAWLEPVKPQHIADITLVTEVDTSRVKIVADAVEADRPGKVKIEIRDGTAVLGEAEGAPGEAIHVPIPDAKLWSPDSPFLYDLKVALVEEEVTLDTVDSYFGMRSIATRPGENGMTRMMLNGKPMFQFGPLNQGFWPDGLHTPPTDEALKFDLETIKRFGGNMMRVHAKIGSRRLYYWADKLGVLVWQDAVTRRSANALNDQWKHELERMIVTHRNHPSIVVWIMFNEGWGQFDTENVVTMAEKLDPTRLVSNTSGSSDKGVGSLHDTHKYPGPAMPEKDDARAKVLGEYGGLGLEIPGHMWNDDDTWGYQEYSDKAKQTDAYVSLLFQTLLLKDRGLSAAVYTQLTDVEGEVNGWLTYDRKIEKIDVARAKAVAESLYHEPPTVIDLVATADVEPQEWRYTLAEPRGQWFSPSFNDESWPIGRSSFGADRTPNSRVNTTWDSEDIWLRRAFDFRSDTVGDLYLKVYHDDAAEVYINGWQVGVCKAWNSRYDYVRIDDAVARTLKGTGNVLAVLCHQDTGGQNIDVGLVSVIFEAKE